MSTYASVAAENNSLTGSAGLTTQANYFSLHSASPSTTGANEISGGTPAYIRVAITWGTASAGSVANATTALTLNVPATTTVDYFDTWGAVSGSGSGGVQIGGPLNTSVTFNTQGTFTVAVGGLTFGSVG